ncbi:MAG: hypothetical protein WCQ89_16290 [Verrucomicrobiota bacterium]
MLHLENRDLRVELLDPANPVDAERQGSRYGWGGYIWQIHDSALGPLLAGPEYPKSDPTPFNGQGLPESFRHRTRDGQPLTWSGDTGLGIGIGVLGPGESTSAAIKHRCAWTITPAADHIIFQTRQSAAGLAYELTRKIELVGRTVSSHSQLTNVGEQTLALQWFAHPFWALSAGQARLRLPLGCSVTENPGFALAEDGTLTFKRPFVAETDSQFALLTLPTGRPLTMALDHPKLKQVTFASSFAPDECPVWANAHTVSVEPYLTLRLAPGETKHWFLRHGFGEK